MAKWFLPNNVGLFSPAFRKGVATTVLTSSLLLASTNVASPWGYREHARTGRAVGVKIPALLTKADMFRRYDHFVNYPVLNPVALSKTIERVFNVDKYEALHLIGDYSQPLHAYRYNKFNKQFHEMFDYGFGDIDVRNLANVEPATGNIRKNIRNLILDSNREARKFDLKNKMITATEATARQRKSIAIMKQYLKEYPGVGLVPGIFDKGAGAKQDYISAFLKSKKLPTEAKAISNVISKNTRTKLITKPTTGLVNKVLHNRKVNHTIESIIEKTKHLFKR